MTNYEKLVEALRCGEYKPECGSSDCPYWSGLGCMDGQLMEDAAAAIESLQAEVKDLKRVNMELFEDLPKYGEQISHWVSVEDPPKENGKYVAINTKTNWWYEASYENGNWKAVDLFCQRWVLIHPTHWMPIEPPQEVQE